MKIPEAAVERLFFLAALFCASLALFILVFMLVLGRPLLTGDFLPRLLTEPWLPDRGLYGILPMLVGTVSIALLALLLALPMSLGCAVLISVIRPPRFGPLLERVVEFLTGMPTVVIGFVGVFLLVPLLRENLDAGSGRCILAAAIGLAGLIAPTLILFFSDAFARVPAGWRQAAAALGCSRSQIFFRIILPHSLRGLASGVVLALGRAVGDTLIALMLAGNAVAVPHSVLSPARTLTAHIAMLFAADFESLEFKIIFACGLLLYLVSLLLTLLIRGLERRGRCRI